MVSDFAALQYGVQQFRRCILRVGRHKPNHEFAWDIVDFLQELCKCQRLFQVFSVGIHILSQQHDLFVAVCHQLADFRRICSGSRLRSLPRTYGTMQYVQKLLQPNIMGTDALNGCSRDGTIPSYIASYSPVSQANFFPWKCSSRSPGKRLSEAVRKQYPRKDSATAQIQRYAPPTPYIRKAPGSDWGWSFCIS